MAEIENPEVQDVYEVPTFDEALEEAKSVMPPAGAYLLRALRWGMMTSSTGKPMIVLRIGIEGLPTDGKRYRNQVRENVVFPAPGFPFLARIFKAFGTRFSGGRITRKGDSWEVSTELSAALERWRGTTAEQVRVYAAPRRQEGQVIKFDSELGAYIDQATGDEVPMNLRIQWPEA